MWEGPHRPDVARSSFMPVAALRSLPHYELWCTGMVMGVAGGSSAGRALFAGRANLKAPVARIRFLSSLAAPRRDSRSASARDTFCVTTARTRARHHQSGAAALGLHVPGC